ncbi:PQQ-binding-like beta-propeller repeat protein, partial [Devosia sp. LC5]|uniref:outer membrane protein assembly factor BamB family protein n=1 Tax=Devosia sp. LC5 TaxID=1502724 RepID=UPI00054DA267
MLWQYALPKERNVSARTPGFWRDQIVGVFTYDRKSFFESAVIALSNDDGRELWRQTIAHVATEPVIDANGTIFVASFAGAVHAYSPDGNALWDSPFSKSNLTPPVLSNGRLFIAETGGSGSKTWCLDARNGEAIWSAENGGHSYRPHVAGDRVFHATVVAGRQFGQSSIHLHCLHCQTGEKIWSVEVDQYHFNVIMAGNLLLWGAR